MNNQTEPLIKPHPIRINCQTCKGKKVKGSPEDAPIKHTAFLIEIPCVDCKGTGFYTVNRL